MLDLFCGTGGASAAFRAAGWDATRVDVDPQFAPDVCADLTTWRCATPPPVDFVWASPPCDEFSRESMPWCRTGNPPSMALVQAAKRIIRESGARYWCIENVRGAVPYLGSPSETCGPFFLWHNLPFLVGCYVPPFKESLSSTAHIARAAVPMALSAAVLRAVEASLRQGDLFAVHVCRTVLAQSKNGS
jgi:hypothetical protein